MDNKNICMNVDKYKKERKNKYEESTARETNWSELNSVLVKSSQFSGELSNHNLFFENRIVSEYVPTKLAADILGISENALRIKVCRGQVPAHTLGRSLRFRVAEIVGLLKRKE